MNALYNYSRGVSGAAIDAEWVKEETLFYDLISKEYLVELIGSEDTLNAASDVTTSYDDVTTALKDSLEDGYARTFDDADGSSVSSSELLYLTFPLRKTMLLVREDYPSLTNPEERT